MSQTAQKFDFRGVVLETGPDLSAEQIAARIEAASAAYRVAVQTIERSSSGSPDVLAGVAALRSWLDVGMASIALAGHGVEVGVYTAKRKGGA